MFFLNKNDIEEFQYRCVIAIFLDNHSKVKFKKFEKKFHFKGDIEGKLKDIYLFNTPSNSEAGGIVFRTKEAGKNANYEYDNLRDDFIDEYRNFAANSYDYIKHNFVSKKWETKYGQLFVSKPPNQNELFKYKSDPSEDDKTSMDIFHNFIHGQLTFVNPVTCNDPFDCDCEILINDELPKIIKKAIIKTKYSDEAISGISTEIIESVVKNMEIEINDEGVIHDQDIIKILKVIFIRSNRGIQDKNVKILVDYINDMMVQVKNLKKEFRILCLSRDPKDILMWGYYGNSGRGTCCKYTGTNIENAISIRGGNICLYGDVSYPEKNRKPKYKLGTKYMMDNVFEFIVECTFTKFHSWKHENEFRYILLGEDFNNDYVTVDDVAVDYYYLGSKNADVKLYSRMTWPQNPYKLKKDPVEYKLI